MSSAIANGPQTLTGNSLSDSSSSDLYKQPTLPSWLSTDYTTTTKTLQDAYNGIDAAYDPSAQVAALQAQSSGAVDTANRASSNAASEYAYRDMLSGGNAGGAGAMKAQIQLQGLNQANQYGTQAATISDTARQAAMTAKLSAAEQMGNIQNSYLGTLATSYAAMQSNATQQASIAAQQSNALLSANAAIATSNNQASLQKYYDTVNGKLVPQGNNVPSNAVLNYGNPNPISYFT